LIVQYIINDEATSGNSDVYNKLNAMHWWLYPSGTSGTPVPASYSGTTATNNTTFTQKDANGYNFVTWYANWAYSTYAAPAPSLDGFFTDNVFVTPNVTGDWSLDGKAESPDATSAQWQQQGYVQHFATLNQLMPGNFLLGNLATWANGVPSLYNQMLQGGVMEGMIGYSWSVETWGGWQHMMSQAQRMMAALAEPKLGLFEQVGSPTDYQSFRYGLTSTMMTDAYFVFNSASGGNANYSSNPWFDEYAWQGKLGQATTATPTAAWQNGVYRRDFQGGIALVNPKGNGPQTVTLETTYTRLSSTCPTCQNQAPTVNSGQPVTTLTLQDRDGIILLRTAQQAVPDAPTLSVN
jgi:hypothetical protein